jgi:hypothetical protein
MAGDPAILQQAAATQLLMAQEPVPVKMLLGDGVLERLLQLATQLAAMHTPDGGDIRLHVACSCMDLSNGNMSFAPPGLAGSRQVGEGNMPQPWAPRWSCLSLCHL